MPEIDFEVPLDGTDLEWMRVRFTTLSGRVVAFMVQYETTFRGRRMPVVRYDNAHGFAHQDMLDWQGNLVAKNRILNDPPPGIALTLAERDIRANWPRYRAWFFGGE